MPRRNLILLVAAALVAVICYHRVQIDPYGRILSQSLDFIDRHALDPVGEKKLFEGAMQGMMSQLGDKKSSYIPPVESKEFLELLDGEFEGVGIVLDQQTRELTVLNPVYGSPAAEAGIRAGDKILRIDGRSTQGLSRQDSVALIRGKLGEPVTLTVQHVGDEKPVEVNIVRGTVREETVLGETRNADGSWNYFLPGKDRIAYVRITSFTKNTFDEFKHVLKELAAHGMKGLILDLRNNPGGIFDVACDVCKLFVKQGIIVEKRGRHGQIAESFRADGAAPYPDLPLAVLVNGLSASASEIVASCLQDHHRAVIIGERSYGKGTVQQVYELDHDAGALKLTIATYSRPSGQNINRRPDAKKDDTWGVLPDPGFEVPLNNDELVRWSVWRERRDAAAPPPADDNFVDRQREKAVEYLEKKIQE
jgi:carboxyl-terminal processing protease